MNIRIMAASVAVAAVAAFGGGDTSYAGWMDDWVDQHVTTKPGYLSGQQRGYFTAGGFSARTYNKNEYLFNIETPRLDPAGCGGIDAFLGGFSYLKPKYLVKKLGKVATSPAFWFDIAMQVFCEECSVSMKDFEKIVNELNQINVSECGIKKTIVTRAKHWRDDQSERQQAESQSQIESGTSDSAQEVKDEQEASDRQPTSTTQAQTEKCSDDVKLVFFQPNSSLLANLAAKFPESFKSDQVDLLRGFIGDVYIKDINGTQIPILVPFCAQNKEAGTDALLTGNVHEKGVGENATCEKVGDPAANLSKWSSERVMRIVQNMSAGTAISAADIAFIDKMPVPVYSMLKVAAKNQDYGMAMRASDMIARGYAVGMLNDLYGGASMVSVMANQVMQVAAEQNQKGCQLALTDRMMESVNKFGENARARAAATNRLHSQSMQEMVAMHEIARRGQEALTIMDATLSREVMKAWARSMAAGQ